MQNLVNPSVFHNHETLARCRYGRMQLKASGAINGNLISKLQSSLGNILLDVTIIMLWLVKFGHKTKLHFILTMF